VPNYFAYLSYVMLTTFTPGPNNIMSMSNACRLGFRRSLRFTAGVCAGFFVVMALACTFTVVLFRALPSVKPLMTVIGAAYILWLAYKTATAPLHAAEGAGDTGTFTAGALLQFVNPKGILYGITAAATFLVPYYKSPLTLGGFCLFMAVVSFIATSSWAAFGSLFETFLSRSGKVVSWIMAALLVYCAVSLFH
jgi:threonine/homoserine/homoserine lactone efflux protein